MALFKSQEARRQAALQARAAALVQAQARAQTQLKQAQAVIEHEKQAVQAGLQAEIGRLASEIIRTVLRPAMAPSQAGGQ
jgi:F0F1-type ATP synthase membrane subunit b/b'